MKTSMQLRALIRNLAKEKGVGAEVILRNYMFERLLERVALSAYSESLILKGGMLITAMVGLDMRTTMDMDATIRGQNLTEAQVIELFRKILSVILAITSSLPSRGFKRSVRKRSIPVSGFPLRRGWIIPARF